VKTAALLLGTTLLVTLAAAAKKPGDPARGKIAFQQCAMCHNTATVDKKMGPSLKGLFHKQKMQNGKRVTEPSVRALIDQGGSGMPPFREMLSDQEKDDLLAYLKSL
jgi:cytochrome c